MAANNDKYWFALIQKTQRGEKWTKDDEKFYINNVATVDVARLQELATKARAKGEDGNVMPLSPDETTELLTLMGQQNLTSDGARAMYLKKAEDIAKTDLGNKIASVLNTTLAAGDIISSTKQINEARRLARQSRRPSAPPALTRDPELQNAIAQAQQGNYDAARALEPAKLAIFDTYLSDIANAQTASTGQAGAFGALGQVASSRRNRGNINLAPIGDSITARNQSRLDNLLAMRLGENQAIQQSQAQNYAPDLRQYQLEQESIGGLGATGRQNMRQSLLNLGSQVPGMIANQAISSRYNKMMANLGIYGKDIQDMGAQAYADTNNNWNNAQSIDPVTGEPVMQGRYPEGWGLVEGGY